jgi:hypothetical protein
VRGLPCPMFLSDVCFRIRHPHPSSPARSHSFLWRARPAGAGAGVDVYRWTGKNDYVALCERAYLALGGGDGTFGLYLDAALLDGSSARCPTFDNEVLCATAPGQGKGRTVAFECVGVEVWAVGG